MSEVLSDVERTKLFQSDDAAFYTRPRFVHHVEEPFRDRLTGLYRSELSNGDRVLDLMSSWVSHLPADFVGAAVGHGLNAEELAANDALDEWVVRDLNVDQRLPFETGSFDAVLCAVAVQYLQYPEAVFAEVARVLDSSGVCVVSFSNRMFVQKAIRAWRERDMDERSNLVVAYHASTGAFDTPDVICEQAGVEPFYAVVGRTGRRPDRGPHRRSETWSLTCRRRRWCSRPTGRSSATSSAGENSADGSPSTVRRTSRRGVTPPPQRQPTGISPGRQPRRRPARGTASSS